MSARPAIRKLGTIDCDIVETTPVVFRDRLYRFEYVRERYVPNETGDSYFRFVDAATGETTPAFAAGLHLGSAHVEGDTVFVYGVDAWGGSVVKALRSTDLENWSDAVALDLPGWKIFNNSVTRAGDRWAMAFEINEPRDIAGAPFTNCFAESSDLATWRVLPQECVYAKDRYTACPALRFFDDWFYMIYLETKPGPEYETCIARSRDLAEWESSPLNPVLAWSDEDKAIASPKLTEEERRRIGAAVNRNNSDVDLCEFQGRTIVNYSWGDQVGREFLAAAEYEGPLRDFLAGFFPTDSERAGDNP